VHGVSQTTHAPQQVWDARNALPSLETPFLALYFLDALGAPPMVLVRIQGRHAQIALLILLLALVLLMVANGAHLEIVMCRLPLALLALQLSVKHPAQVLARGVLQHKLAVSQERTVPLAIYMIVLIMHHAMDSTQDVHGALPIKHAIILQSILAQHAMFIPHQLAQPRKDASGVSH
jgi:hypothetical protein